jgi:predicted metal-binding membrane protein
MVLLFYGGVMSLEWIIGLALFILLEKVLPAGHRMGRLSGVVLIIWGITIVL